MSALGDILAESICEKAPTTYGGAYGYHCDHQGPKGKVCCYCGRKVEPPPHGPYAPKLPMTTMGERS